MEHYDNHSGSNGHAPSGNHSGCDRMPGAGNVQTHWRTAVSPIFEKLRDIYEALRLTRVMSYYLSVEPPPLPSYEDLMKKAALEKKKVGKLDAAQLADDNFYACEVRSKQKGIVLAGSKRLSRAIASHKEELDAENRTLRHTPQHEKRVRPGESVSGWFKLAKVFIVALLSLLFVILLVAEFNNIKTVLDGSGLSFESDLALLSFTIPFVVSPFLFLLFLEMVLSDPVERVNKYFLYCTSVIGMVLLVTLIVLFSLKFAKEKTRTSRYAKSRPTLSQSVVGDSQVRSSRPSPGATTSSRGPSFSILNMVSMLFQTMVVMVMPLMMRHAVTFLPPSVSERFETEEYLKSKKKIRSLEDAIGQNEETLLQLEQVGSRLEAGKGAYQLEIEKELLVNRSHLKGAEQKIFSAKRRKAT